VVDYVFFFFFAFSLLTSRSAACPNDCTSEAGVQNGVCDQVLGVCICAPEWTGEDCRLPAAVATSGESEGSDGLSDGQVAGIVIGIGLVLCLVGAGLGFLGAIFYLKHKRKKHFQKLQQEGKA
jgi:hypothetical protein